MNCQEVDRSNCGSFFWSFYRTALTPVASRGKALVASSKWLTRTKLLADGVREKASQIWIMTNSVELYATITTRASWPKYMANDTLINSTSLVWVKRCNRQLPIHQFTNISRSCSYLLIILPRSSTWWVRMHNCRHLLPVYSLLLAIIGQILGLEASIQAFQTMQYLLIIIIITILDGFQITWLPIMSSQKDRGRVNII